jgi:hypothetical protein
MQKGIMPCATFRTVPFQQSNSRSFENYPIRTFRALVFSKAHIHAKCFSSKWQHDNGGAWLKLQLQWKLQQMSGVEPVTMPNPPEATKTCMWLSCEGDVGCTRCFALSAALVPRSCDQGCGRCAHQLSERANASSPCFNINHKPLETNKNVVVEACKRWRRCPVGL